MKIIFSYPHTLLNGTWICDTICHLLSNSIAREFRTKRFLAVKRLCFIGDDPPGGSGGYRCRLDSLGNLSTASGSSDPGGTVYA